MKALITSGLLVSSILLSSSSASAQTPDQWRLVDFDGASKELRWEVVNDTVMGGRSSSQFSIDDQRLVFTGTLNTNGGGFASVRSSALRRDLSGYTSFRIRVRGDGRPYRLRLYPFDDWAAYQSEFKTQPDQWMIVELPIADFYASWRGRRLDRGPMAAADIAGLGFILADGLDGPFKLEIDWIEVTIQSTKEIASR
ncbi:MAG: CIA30 family protein [Pseudomonadota bacterium]